MLGAELVVQVDDDRYAVDFLTPQTTHEQLQARADARAASGETRRANRVAQRAATQDKAKTEKARQARAEAQARYRQNTAEAEDIPPPDEPPFDDPADDAGWTPTPAKTCTIPNCDNTAETGTEVCPECAADLAFA